MMCVTVISVREKFTFAYPMKKRSHMRRQVIASHVKYLIQVNCQRSTLVCQQQCQNGHLSKRRLQNGLHVSGGLMIQSRMQIRFDRVQNVVFLLNLGVFHAVSVGSKWDV